MAHYLVRANPHEDLLAELRARLDSGEIRQMRPFGQALHYSLTHARKADEGGLIWEEEDYCRPPLAQERAAVLDTYFTGLQVTPVDRDQGWEQIENLERLWEE